MALTAIAIGRQRLPRPACGVGGGLEAISYFGFIRPGDRLHETALVDFGGSLVVQARTLRLRVAGQAGVGTGSPALSTIEVSSSSVASLEVNRRHLVTSATQTRSQGATAYAPGSGGSASVAVTIPSLDAPVWLRPSAQNASSNGTITIHHYGLTLEPKR